MTRVSMTLPQYRRRECSIDGRAVPLAPMACEMLSLLLAAPPDRVLDPTTLIDALWPDPDASPVTADKCIQTLVVRMRKLGLPIENDWGRGYFIAATARGGERAPPLAERAPPAPPPAAVKACGRQPRRPLNANAMAICASIRGELIRVGWSRAARQSGIDRSVLHRAFPANTARTPSFETVASVAAALGFDLTLARRAAQ